MAGSYSERMMKFDIMVRPLEVLVVVVVDHLQVERDVCSVSEATALLEVVFVVLSLVDAVLQFLGNLLHLVSHPLDLEIAACYNGSHWCRATSIIYLHLQTLFVLLPPQSALHSISNNKFNVISSIFGKV